MAKRKLITACLIVTAILSLVTAKAWLSREAEGRRLYPLTIVLNDARGLNRGAEVQIAGVKVGQVEKVTLDPNLQHALIQVRLRREIQIPSDSLAFAEPPALKIRVGSAYGCLAPGEQLLTIEERLRRKSNE